MSEFNATYVKFLGAVLPDVQKDYDRICMAVLEMEIEEYASKPDSYDDKVAELRQSLFTASKDSNSDLMRIYPATYLCYWVDIRAAYWKNKTPPPSVPGNVTALKELLSSAGKIQSLVKGGLEDDGRASAIKAFLGSLNKK